MVFNIFRNRMVKASDFFFSKLCPFWAPFSLAFIVVMALKNKSVIHFRLIMYIQDTAHTNPHKCQSVS